MKAWEAKDLILQIKNLTPGNEVHGNRPTGELVVGTTTIPCILQQVVQGGRKGFDSALPRRRVVVLRWRPIKRSPFIDAGYLSLQVLWKDDQYEGHIFVYIPRSCHKELIRHFSLIRPRKETE